MLKGVKAKIHVRDLDEFRLMARRLRRGVLRLPQVKGCNKPSPMEPQYSFITAEVRVPEERITAMKLVAEKLNKLRQKGAATL